MADPQKALEDLDKSHNDLIAKHKAYMEALEKLKDVQKAVKNLETAIADASAKLETAKKALEDFVKANKAAIESDPVKKAALKQIYENFKVTEAVIKNAQADINRHRA
jgi:chromosome segregation ATPase